MANYLGDGRDCLYRVIAKDSGKLVNVYESDYNKEVGNLAYKVFNTTTKKYEYRAVTEFGNATILK